MKSFWEELGEVFRKKSLFIYLFGVTGLIVFILGLCNSTNWAIWLGVIFIVVYPIVIFFLFTKGYKTRK